MVLGAVLLWLLRASLQWETGREITNFILIVYIVVCDFSSLKQLAQ